MEEIVKVIYNSLINQSLKFFYKLETITSKKKKKKIHVELNVVEQEQARNYVLQNCDEVSPFIE